MIYLLNYIPL